MDNHLKEEETHQNFTQLNEQEFRRVHEEYMSYKLECKKELRRKIKQQYESDSSSSSSDQSFQDSKVQQSAQNQNCCSSQISHNEEKQKNQKIAIIIPAKKLGSWTKQAFSIADHLHFFIGSCSYALNKIKRVKIVRDPIIGIPFKIYVTLNTEEIVLASALNEKNQRNLPLHYYIFARLLQEKLLQQSVQISQPIPLQMEKIPKQIISSALIYGKIFKKSQFFGKWEERYVVINNAGLFSYKKLNEKYTLSIMKGSVEEIQTQFELFQNKYMIIKVEYSSKKTQFRLPLVNMLNCKNWLYHFYGLM